MSVTILKTALPTHRPLRIIAAEITVDWSSRGEGVSIHAYPYLKAMMELNHITENYHLDSAAYIVRYCLANMASYRGGKAKELKQELKDILLVLDTDERLIALANQNVTEEYKR